MNYVIYHVKIIMFQVIKLLDSHGAKRDSYLSDIVSHVIADSTKPDEYSEAKELFERPVVSVSSLLYNIYHVIFLNVVNCFFIIYILHILPYYYINITENLYE